MPIRTVDFREDLPKIRRHIDRRVRAQAKAGGVVTAIEIGFRLCQAGYVVLNFDTRPKHRRDGHWTNALVAPGMSMAVRHWSSAYMSAGRQGVEFVLLSGKRKSLPAGANDEVVAGVFGETLLSILGDAKARGALDLLTFSPDCQVEVLEFDGMWEWPAKKAELGKTNLYKKLRPAKLQL